MRPEHVEYDVVDDRIGVITFRRPRTVDPHGPGDAPLLRELDDAWQTAADDRRVRVIVLRSTGPHFYAGLDGSDATAAARLPAPRSGDHGWERRHQLHYARAWRGIPKPSVAAVQGRCDAGGVLLCSPCGHVVAADDAEFSRPLTGVVAGVSGRTDDGRAAGTTMTAAEAQGLGLVTTVVPFAALHSTALALARDLPG